MIQQKRRNRGGHRETPKSQMNNFVGAGRIKRSRKGTTIDRIRTLINRRPKISASVLAEKSRIQRSAHPSTTARRDRADRHHHAQTKEQHPPKRIGSEGLEIEEERASYLRKRVAAESYDEEGDRPALMLECDGYNAPENIFSPIPV